MSRINVVELPEERDPERIAEALLSVPEPADRVIIAPMTHGVSGCLETAIEEARAKRHNLKPLLIGIEHEPAVIDPLRETFSTVLRIGSNKEHKTSELMRFLPLLAGNDRVLGEVGSVQVYDEPVTGVPQQDPNLEQVLAIQKGEALHGSVRGVAHPDFYTIAAPGDYISIARRVLGSQAPILDTRGANENKVFVGAFTFQGDTVRDQIAEFQPQPNDPYNPLDGQSRGSGQIPGQGQRPQNGGQSARHQSHDLHPESSDIEHTRLED